MERLRFIIIFIFFVVTPIYAFTEEEKFGVVIKELDEKGMQELVGEKKPATEAIVRPSAEYRAGDLRDPFQSPFLPEETSVAGPAVPTEAAPQTPPSLKVQGIIWGGDFPQAIINNTVVKIGDIIEDAEIMDINQSGVIVACGNYTYSLPSPAQKQDKEYQGGEK